MAIALAAENKAKIEENRALVVLAEAEVPKAMAEAFRSGNMGIMDYYRMKNIQADTSMRDTIGQTDTPKDKKDLKRVQCNRSGRRQETPGGSRDPDATAG